MGVCIGRYISHDPILLIDFRSDSRPFQAETALSLFGDSDEIIGQVHFKRITALCWFPGWFDGD
jgi:hypothetical protein